MNELPDSWETVELGRITTIRTGRLDANAAVANGAYPFFTCGEQTLAIDNYAFDTEAILLAGNGGFGVKWYKGKFNAYQRTYVIEPNGAYGRYLFYVIRNAIPHITQNNRGSTIKYLRLGDIIDTVVPFPPIAEQQRIADTLDRLLARVDACCARLGRVPALLKRFRQAVLAAAVAGRLTGDWRGENPDTEPAQLLLKRIRSTRLANQDRSRKLHAHSNETENYVPSLLDAPEQHLPATWAATNIGAIGTVSNGSTPSRKVPSYWDGDIPWVSSGEVQNCIITETSERISHEGYKNSSVRLLPSGTVLLAMIGEGKTRGQSAILDIDACINQNIAAIVIDHGMVESKYLWYWFQSGYEATRQVGSGSGPQALNCQRVRELPFTLPPLAEQHEIVRRVEILFAYADHLDARLAAAQARVAQLTPSLLGKAFRGELGTTTTDGESNG